MRLRLFGLLFCVSVLGAIGSAVVLCAEEQVELNSRVKPEVIRDIMWVWNTHNMDQDGEHTLATWAHANVTQKMSLLDISNVTMCGPGLPGDDQEAIDLTESALSADRIVWEISTDDGLHKPPFAYTKTAERIRILYDKYPKVEAVLLDDMTSMSVNAGFKPEHILAIRDLLPDKFDLIESISAGEGPKFVYSHFILPHYPWKFDRDGSPVSRTTAASRSKVENYVNQLIYTNRRIEQLVDVILANSAADPIIVIQADEGPELIYEGDEKKDRDARIRKRSGIISAFRLPERDAAKLVPSNVSPVNTFRLIFREYFGADISMLGDRNYYWDNPKHLGKLDTAKLN